MADKAPQYLYRVEEYRMAVGTAGCPRDLQVWLDAQGADSWELISATCIESVLYLVLKKQKP